MPSLSTDEYEFVALSPIDLNGVRAFNAGDPVPAGHVEAHSLQSSGRDAVVAKRGSKAAEKVEAEAPRPDDVPVASTPATATGPAAG